MIYEESEFDTILKKVGKPLPENKSRSDFEERLNDCAMFFLQNYGAEKADAPSVIRDRLKKIENKSKQLIDLTKGLESSSAVVRLRRQAAKYQKIRVTRKSLTPSGQLEEQIMPSDFSNVDEIIKGLKDLELYARVAAADENKKVGQGKKRHTGKVARQTFVNDLAGLWSDMFDELPGSSINPHTGEPGGPFIRFIMACYELLRNEWPMLPELDENAARYHSRKSGEAKLKRLVKSDMAKSGKN